MERGLKEGRKEGSRGGTDLVVVEDDALITIYGHYYCNHLVEVDDERVRKGFLEASGIGVRESRHELYLPYYYI